MTRYFENRKDFEEIFKEYFNPLVNFIHSYISNWEDCREIVQSTFLKAWKNKDKLDIHTSIKSYLYQAARNTMIDHLRKTRKMTDYQNEIMHSKPGDNEFHELDPYIVKQAIYKAMETLKPKNKKIFELNKFEGLTYSEIAEYLGISERSVEDNISRAMKRLKEQLKNHPELF